MGRFRKAFTSTDLPAAASGLLLAWTYPRVDFAELAWIALVPLLLVMRQRPFRSGFVAGTCFFALVLYWLNVVMVTFGGLHPILSAAAWLLLSLYLALFFAIATWGSCRLAERLGLSIIVTLPVLWVGLEFLRGWLFSGFPWALLGYSQQARLSLIQSADLFGVYGVSFLIVLVNATAAESYRRLRLQGWRSLPWTALLITLFLFGANTAYGFWRLAGSPDQRDRTLDVALVQGNIDQAIKWDPAFQESTIATYRRLSLQAIAQAPRRLLIWPESATPFYFQDSNPLSEQVRQTARDSGAYLLFGSPAYQKVGSRFHFLNSAFLLAPDAKILGRSDKVHLVPFGEYVPLSRYLPFVHMLVQGVGDFSPGEINPLPLDGVRLGVLVCYEGIFPELAREHVHQGAELLVNITNDAWYGRSSAPAQHLSMAKFRAIENRIWLARAANTGISAFISPSGAINGATPLFVSAYVNGSVGLGARPTFYSRIGDLPALCCLALGIIWLARTRERRPRYVKG